MRQIKLTKEDDPYDCLAFFFKELVKTFRRDKVTFKLTSKNVNEGKIVIDVFPETDVNTFNFED